MLQKDFNKKEQFSNLIKQSKEKELPFSYVLEEVKRMGWNINEAQVIEIADAFSKNATTIMAEALDLNILNVSSKLKNKLTKQLKSI